MGRTYTYEDFFSAEEVAAFKRITRGTMHLADAGREVVSLLLNAPIGDGGRSDKQFLNIGSKQYRLATGSAADNSTEVRAHLEMGVETVFLGDEESIMPFLREHGCYVSWEGYVMAVGRKLRSME